MTIPTVLTIAGSDPSGGAGIQGDIKTIFAEGCYGMAAITGLTAQNTTGVSAVMPVPADFLNSQLNEVLRDIRPDAVKIGMILTAEQVWVMANLIRHYNLENVIIDPVVAPTSGVEFVADEVLKCMVEELFPLSRLITPNLPESESIYKLLVGPKAQKQSHSDIQVQGETIVKPLNLSAKELARCIGKSCGCNVLVKGGHCFGNEATDYMWSSSDEQRAGCISEFKGQKVETASSHGTGCALSSSIASNLAKGYSLVEAIDRGKQYVTAALRSDMHIGTGNSSVDHGALIR